MLLEIEFKDESKKLLTLPLRSRPPTASFPCCPSPSCSSCFRVPSAAGAATAPAPAAATAEFVSALLVLGFGNAALMGDEDSTISFMPLLAVRTAAGGEEEEEDRRAGGSNSEEMLDEPLLSSSDELELLVLLPPPLLRRRKKDAMVLGPPASPRGWPMGCVGRRERQRECSCLTGREMVESVACLCCT